MGDDVIKNPNRNVKGKVDAVPLYKKMGLTPLPAIQEEFSTLDAHVISDNETDSSSPIFVSGFADPDENNEALPPPVDIPEVGDFILMIGGEVILHGTMDDILKEARTILYGHSKDFEGIKVEPDDLIVLKRVSLKVGVFIEQ